MSPSKMRKAIGAVKDHTSIGLALVFGGDSRSDLEVAIIKATRHQESPRHERHVREIICLTSFSRPMISVCVSAIGKRLSKTRNWVVALKTLMLVHRLINDGDHGYEEQILFAKRHGRSFLSMSGFRDTADSRDYSTFIRMYASYLDQQLEFRVNFCKRVNSRYACQGDAGAASRTPPVHEMTNADIFSRAHQLLQLLDKFLACRPTGSAKCNKLVTVALYTTLKESFNIFYDITEVTATLVDRFMQLPVPDMIKVHRIFSCISKQYVELGVFYDWCKTIAIMRPSKFPNVEKIPKEKLDTMNDFIRQKSEMLRNTNIKCDEAKPDEDEQVMKALPDACVELDPEIEKKIQDMGDLLNLDEDPVPSTEQDSHDMLALALFDGLTVAPESTTTTTTTTTTATTNPWEAFNDSTDDWETKLVQSVSYMSANPSPSLPGDFDTLMLDSMYQVGPNGKTETMLALPAAPATANDGAPETDPFAASLTIAPPGYVQISVMEEKRRFSVEEQFYWQQYGREGMQGHVAVANVCQQYPHQYVAGGYMQAW